MDADARYNARFNTSYIGGKPCIYGCGQNASHYTIFVCPDRVRTGTCKGRLVPPHNPLDDYFLELAFGSKVKAEHFLERASAPKVTLEIVMSGAAVRHARELHAIRNRKPLMSEERRGHGTGEIDLGEL
ncbi:MAG: hypothetical protein ACRD52_07240 [Candidatus Acidiferrales bacterium]